MDTSALSNHPSLALRRIGLYDHVAQIEGLEHRTTLDPTINAEDLVTRLKVHCAAVSPAIDISQEIGKILTFLSRHISVEALQNLLQHISEQQEENDRFNFFSGLGSQVSQWEGRIDHRLSDWIISECQRRHGDFPLWHFINYSDQPTLLPEHSFLDDINQASVTCGNIHLVAQTDYPAGTCSKCQVYWNAILSRSAEGIDAGVYGHKYAIIQVGQQATFLMKLVGDRSLVALTTQHQSDHPGRFACIRGGLYTPSQALKGEVEAQARISSRGIVRLKVSTIELAPMRWLQHVTDSWPREKLRHLLNAADAMVHASGLQQPLMAAQPSDLLAIAG